MPAEERCDGAPLDTPPAAEAVVCDGKDRDNEGNRVLFRDAEDFQRKRQRIVEEGSEHIQIISGIFNLGILALLCPSPDKFARVSRNRDRWSPRPRVCSLPSGTTCCKTLG